MTTTAIPTHVRPEQVFDFDYYAVPGGDRSPHNAWYAWMKEHSPPDIFYSPRYGGHWVVTRGNDLKQILHDHRRFSSRKNSIPYETAKPFLLAPIEYDPPLHTEVKKLQIGSFTPRAIESLEAEMRQLCGELIDPLKPKGKCDFIADFALRMPIDIFLKMMGLPEEDRLKLLDLVETRVRNPSLEAQQRAYVELMAYSVDTVRQRRERPGTDLISQVIGYRLQGRQLTDNEIQGFLMLLWFAGLDTVSSSMGFMMRFLAENPAHRQQLVNDPKLIPNAVEELLRRFGVSLPARVVTEDLDFNGVQMRAGDQVLLPLLLHGLDEQVYLDPLNVDFQRKNAGLHLTFGDGVHRCSGSYLARLELRVFLEEWLARISDFSLDPERPVRTSTGVVNGTLELPLVWQS